MDVICQLARYLLISQIKRKFPQISTKALWPERRLDDRMEAHKKEVSDQSCDYQEKGGKSEMLFLPREEGQGLVEYALILVLVAIVVIAILLLLGPVIGNVFSGIVNAL